jgi:hypothetical protein
MLDTNFLKWGYLVLPSKKFTNDVSTLFRTFWRA